jgi:outer membrane lipoprotein-sorting protein
MKKLMLAAALLTFGAALFAQSPDWHAILSKIDEMTNFGTIDFSAEITVVTTRPGEENEAIQARYFRRDSEEKFLILILKPEVQKGQGYLAVGDSLWFYDPENRKFAFSSLKDRFADSGANNEDFSSSRLSRDYTVQSWEEVQLGKFDTWAVVLTANSSSVPIAKLKLWIRRDNYLVLKQEEYSLTDRLLRTTAIPNYQIVNGRYIPVQMLTVDNVKVGEKTQITFKNPSVTRLPDSVFTKTYLERVNQ